MERNNHSADAEKEKTPHVMQNGELKKSLEDMKTILTTRIVETNRRIEELEELKRKKLEFLLSKR
jgi:hypothetical protein